MSKQNREINRAQRAAAIQQAQARKERNVKLAAVVGVVVVILAIVAFAVISATGGGKGTSAVTPKAAVIDNVLTVGNNPAAAHKVVVYEDFLCPFCREFEDSSRDFLHEYAAKGKVLVEYRPFHLLQDDYSANALNAFGAVLMNGTPAQALKFHDKLFDEQPYEQANNKPGISEITKWAKSVGADSPEVVKAIKTRDQAYFDATLKAAEDAKVQGTPTVFIDGQLLQGSSVQDMANNLQKMISKG